MSNYIWDSSALLMVINEEPGFEKAQEYLSNAYISAVNISEVASIMHAVVGIKISETQHLINKVISHSIPFDEAHAYQTAALRLLTKSKGLSLGDRACIAAAQIKKLPIITADSAWQGLDFGIKTIFIRCHAQKN